MTKDQLLLLRRFIEAKIDSALSNERGDRFAFEIDHAVEDIFLKLLESCDR